MTKALGVLTLYSTTPSRQASRQRPFNDFRSSSMAHPRVFWLLVVKHHPARVLDDYRLSSMTIQGAFPSWRRCAQGARVLDGGTPQSPFPLAFCDSSQPNSTLAI